MARFVPIVIQLQGAQQGTAQVQGFAQSFNTLNTAAGNAGSQGIRNAFISAEILFDSLKEGLRWLKDLAVETILYAGRTGEMDIALQQLARTNGISTETIEKEVKALEGANIGRQEALQVLSQMISLNLDVAKAEALANVAKNSAVIANKNSSETYRDLIDAIQTGRTEQFRALGIFFNVNAAVEKGARALHLHKDALDENQQAQIRLDATIEAGARLEGTYEAAMGSAYKQLLSTQRLLDDAKESVGGLFQGAFGVAIKIAQELLVVIAKYPVTFIAIVGSLGLLTASFVLYETTLIPRLVAGGANLVKMFQNLIFWTVNWRVAMTDAQVATSVLAGWAAVAIVVGAIVIALTNEASAAEKANAITQEQIKSMAGAWESSKTLAAAANEVATAQAGSADRHQKLNEILSQLDPRTRVYIEALEAEKDRIAALTAEIDRNVAANKGALEASLRTIGGGILQQFDEIDQRTSRIAGIEAEINRQQALLAKDPSWAETLRPGIASLSQDVLDQRKALKTLTDQVGENQAKFVLNAQALGLNRDQTLALFKASGYTADQTKKLGEVFDTFTPKVTEQAKQIDALKKAFDDLALGEDKTAKAAIEGRISAAAAEAGSIREALQKLRSDKEFTDLAARLKKFETIKKGVEDVLTQVRPSPIQQLTHDLQTLRPEVEALKRGGGPLFNLQVEKEQLEATKSEYADILKLRRQLGIEESQRIPEEANARRAELQDLQDLKNAQQRINDLRRQLHTTPIPQGELPANLIEAQKFVEQLQKQLDFSHNLDQQLISTKERIFDLGAAFDDPRTNVEKFDFALKVLKDTGVLTDDAMARLKERIDAVRASLGNVDVAEAVQKAEAARKAIYDIRRGIGEQIIQAQRGIGPLPETFVDKLLTNLSNVQNLKLLPGSFDVAFKKGTLSLRELLEAIGGTRADVSRLGPALQAAIEPVIAASPEIQKITDKTERLNKVSEISVELASALQDAYLANAKSVEAYRLALENLRKGDPATVARVVQAAADERLKGEVTTAAQLAVLRDQEKTGYFQSAEFIQDSWDKAELARRQSSQSAAEEIIALQYQIEHAGEDSAQRVAIAQLKAIGDVLDADTKAAEARAANLVLLSHQTDINYARMNDGVIDFLGHQKTLQQTFEDARTNTVKAWFEGVDGAIDRMTTRLLGASAAGKLLNSVLKDLAHLLLSSIIQRLLGIAPQGPSFGAGGQQQSGGGGILGFFANLLGLGSRSQSGGAAPALGGFGGYPGGTPPFAFAGGGGFAGFGGYAGAGSQGPGVGFGGGQQSTIQRLTSQFFGGLGVGGLGGGITPPTSLSSRVNPGGVAGSVLNKAITRTSPDFLTRFGFQSPGGGLSFGGAALALSTNIAIFDALFGKNARAALGGGQLAQILGPIVANPFLVGFPLFALFQILGRNALRRKNETDRAALNSDTYSQVIQVLNDARAGKYDSASAALAAFDQIKSNYFQRISGYDSKTRRIAAEVWNDTKNGFEYYRPLIQKAAEDAAKAKEVEKHLVPEFAYGGTVPYRSTLFSMASGLTPIRVTPGEAMQRPGSSFAEIVPGNYRGVADTVLTAVPPGTRITPRAQVRNIRGFANGGTVGNGGDGGGPTPVIIEELNLELAVGDDTASKIVVKGVKTSDGGNAVVKRVNTFLKEGN